MDFKNALKYLESFVSYEKVPMDLAKLKLEKLVDFLREYGVDYSGLKFFHVAGSKGKGTVCHLIADYLVASGRSVGLFTSPHMLSVCERIRVGGEDVAESDFADAVERFKDFYEEKWSGEALTYFEILLVLALDVFVREGVEYAVLEVGLGGRLDATNIVEPQAAVVTTIENEHAAILGDTVEKIAAEKLAIGDKEGVPLILGYQRDEVYGVAGAGALKVEEVFGPATGAFEKNTNTVALALETVLGELDLEVFSKVVEEFSLIGRFDVREIAGKEVVFDMAHTAESIEDFVRTLKLLYRDKGFVFLLSVLKDKDLEKILELCGGCGQVVFTESDSERSISIDDERLEGFEVEKDCLKAFDRLVADTKKDQVLVVTGSHFLVSKILSKRL